jgi:hypothetical protein
MRDSWKSRSFAEASQKWFVSRSGMAIYLASSPMSVMPRDTLTSLACLVGDLDGHLAWLDMTTLCGYAGATSHSVDSRLQEVRISQLAA